MHSERRKLRWFQMLLAYQYSHSNCGRIIDHCGRPYSTKIIVLNKQKVELMFFDAAYERLAEIKGQQ